MQNTAPVIFGALLGMVSFFTVSAAVCNGIQDCGRCANTSSWIGSCRWCPRDGECHAYGTIFTNPCKRAENIVDSWNCEDEVSQYVPDTSLKMLLASAAAYDTRDPQKCLESMLSESDVAIRRIVTRDCGFSDNECSGYVALSHAERAIIVAFRGTKDFSRAFEVFITTILLGRTKFLDGEVQTFWKTAFDALWPSLEEEVQSLRSRHPNYKVWVTGHSLGGAIASLASTWMVHEQLATRKDVVLYTFGMPRVGNYKYALQHDRLVNNSWRIVNSHDAVPHFPSAMKPNPFTGPYHHGVEVHYYNGASSAHAPHKECLGNPHNEDFSCGFSSWLPSFKDHISYFGIEVGRHCKNFSENHEGTHPLPVPINSSWNPEFLKDKTKAYTYANGSYEDVTPAPASTAPTAIIICCCLAVIAVASGLAWRWKRGQRREYERI